jgi:hypothetical protein
LSILIGAITPCIAQNDQSATSSAENSFEELPELKASEILRPEFLKGAHFTVREAVPTASGMNQFSIDSDYGVFEADGNAMLVQRVGEIAAIAQLKDVSRTDQFKQSLGTAAKGPYNAAKNVVQDPGAAVSSAGKGIMKFMKRTGNTMKNVSQGTTEKSSDEKTGESMIGYARAKRQVAARMGIDPYSTNTVLQKELDGIAWASWGGGFAFRAATFPIGGGVGMALTATSVSKTVGQLINEKTATELKAINRSTLEAMGVNGNDIEHFLENSAFTTTHQTAFTQNLKVLAGVENRAAFVHAAAKNSTEEADAVFCVLTASLMGKIHTGEKPLARIVMLGDFPVCVAKDGTVVLALQWDYAAWTPRAASFISQIQEFTEKSGNKGVLVALSGQASPLLQQELKNRGFTVQDRVSPGPLK